MGKKCLKNEFLTPKKAKTDEENVVNSPKQRCLSQALKKNGLPSFRLPRGFFRPLVAGFFCVENTHTARCFGKKMIK